MIDLEQWKKSEERYIRERNWLLDIKKVYTPEVLNLKKQAIPEGSSKVVHYTNIVEEVWQKAQSIEATYLICAPSWLPIFRLTAAFENIIDVSAIQGSYTAGMYKGLFIIISPVMDSFEILCGADTPMPEYGAIDTSKFILLKLED